MKRILLAPLLFLKIFYQSVYLAISQIWANKMRSSLTTLGIVIGVASVVAVIASLAGLKAKILKEVEVFGTNMIYIEPRRPNTGPKSSAPWHLIRFEPEQFDGLGDHCPSVERFGRLCWAGQMTLSSGDRTVDGVIVRGIEPDVQKIERRNLILGRPLSIIDEMQSRQVCLIDPKLQNDLRLDKDCIGQMILVGHYTFHVVGVVEPRPQGMFGGGQQETSELFIPFNTANKIRYMPWMVVFAESKTAQTSDDAMAEIKFFLRRTRKLSPGEPDTFHVQSMQSFLKTFNIIAAVTTAIAGGVVGISLLVGGIGIMNIMLVSVSERTREIGLRKAVGAKKTAILTQFLIESVVLCFLGGLIGIGLGQLLTIMITKLPGAKLDMAYIPWWAIVISFGFCAVVGIFFGMFPAIKAARLDPIEALRHE